MMLKRRALLPINEVKRYTAEHESCLVIDVRTAAEYESGHLPGARLHTLDTIAVTLPTAAPDPATPLLLYCRSGARSAQACQILRQLGYKDVTDAGGIMDYTGTLEFGQVQD